MQELRGRRRLARFWKARIWKARIQMPHVLHNLTLLLYCAMLTRTPTGDLLVKSIPTILLAIIHLFCIGLFLLSTQIYI